ncbi:hypothetical protein QNI19_29200 [Cytophagaceae bacterium DM2B3-1]|uniref:Uncharacterized protein n=1 Tax=Xanthocytophaga flava TaxID=3048013 RepID=A0ABT7CTM4_9BACT|nr:hypothetical protein [Xanthocytophaga flavus]MDJ1467923.1 hypothetical protein [Xanthocytophaga flavus]MDJ1497050.1 hypothetical protein [Xanthocytophaga flavus]
MSNVKTLVDEWSVRDLEDNSSLKIVVESCTELGNKSLPEFRSTGWGIFSTMNRWP